MVSLGDTARVSLNYRLQLPPEPFGSLFPGTSKQEEESPSCQKQLTLNRMRKAASWDTVEMRNMCGTQVTQSENFLVFFAHMNGNMQQVWPEKFMLNRRVDSS